MNTTSEEQWKKEWAVEDKFAKDRLPDGAEFRATYDATAVLWTVSLTAKVNGESIVFSTQRRGIFPALMALDRLYRVKAGLPQRKSTKKNGKRRSGQL